MQIDEFFQFGFEKKNHWKTVFFKATRADVSLDPSHVGSGCPVVGWLVGWMVGPQKAGNVLWGSQAWNCGRDFAGFSGKKIQRFLPQSSENGSVKNECLTFQEWLLSQYQSRFPTMTYRRKTSFVGWHWSFDSWSLFFRPKKSPRSDVLQERRRKAYNVEYYKAGGKRFMLTICHKKYRLLRQVSLGGKRVFPYIHRAMTRLGFTMPDENPSSFESVNLWS